MPRVRAEGIMDQIVGKTGLQFKPSMTVTTVWDMSHSVVRCVTQRKAAIPAGLAFLEDGSQRSGAGLSSDGPLGLVPRKGRRQRSTSIFTDRLVSMVAERRYPPDASM